MISVEAAALAIPNRPLSLAGNRLMIDPALAAPSRTPIRKESPHAGIYL